MTHARHPFPFLAATGCLLFGACQQTGGKAGLSSSDSLGASPSIVGNEDQSRWDYLAAKYDSNGDARISAAEYQRSDNLFSTFDRDDNGYLEAADFASRGGGMQRDPAQMRRMISPMILARYFQADEDEGQLTREEMVTSFGVYDANGDGQVNRAEFETEAEARGATAQGGMDRFDMLAVSAGGEGAEHFSLDQLSEYFDSLDKKGEGSIDASRSMGRRRRPAQDESEVVVDDAPNAAGRMAPDFALERIGAEVGSELVRLSSFAGKKPVALIFGSYT